MQPLSHENICAKKKKKNVENPYARYHMREDQISRLEVQKCSTIEKSLQMNEELLIFWWTVEHFPKYNLKIHWKSLEGDTFWIET